jgi:hypothetical protein
MEAVAEERLDGIARLTAVAFERTCRSLAGCDTKARQAFSSVRE